MSPPFSAPDEDLELLRSAAVSAGIIAAGYFRRELKTWEKEGNSPVSEADIVLDNYLRVTLMAARPDYGWLSEESADDPARLDAERLFVVDPIDGTRGFIRGEDAWSVSLAVVERGRPVAGVVYAPARDEMYAAAIGEGASFNGAPLVAPQAAEDLPLIPAAGAVHAELKTLGLECRKGPHYTSLAYRLTQVARGRMGAVAARRGSMDWDIAAAAIILSEAGAGLEDVCSGVPVFNRPDLRHGALAAFADMRLKPYLHAALIKVYGCPAEEISAQLTI
jgi:myo-inositol-1(or 4)-monophosphatase